ncbi:MAG: DUF6443 domain-containing protein [Bacteroidia bacterium]
MLNKNIVSSPFQTTTKVGSTTTGGSKTEYQFFSHTTGLPVPSYIPGTSFPYPARFYAYEMTWNNGVPTTGTWVQKAEVKANWPNTNPDAKGKMKEFQVSNWPSESYEWERGMIKKRTFQNFIWEYTYQPGSRLLTSIKDIDGQTTSYGYDALNRLSYIMARDSNIVTSFQYQYKDISHFYNSVTTLTQYTTVTGSDLTQQKTIQYLDGIGRALQTVRQGHSPSGKDVIAAIKYDNIGRPTHSYVPYESLYNNGQFYAPPSGTAYTFTDYEASPLSRVKSVTPPEWYATNTDFGTNTSNEVLNYTSGGYYAANQLTKTTVTDPNGNKSIAFTDKWGRVVLSRRRNAAGTQNADTYNLYDDKDRLTTVIPPGATLSSPNLIFTYKYNEKDLITEKKVPDAALVKLYYNQRDQLALVQDGNLAAQNQYMLTHYDDYGRPVSTGFYAGALPGTLTHNSPAITAPNLLTQTTYGTTGIELGKIKTQQTRILDGGNNWLSATYTYDSYGRVSQTTGNHSLNLTPGSESVISTYDFADNPLTRIRTHNYGGTTRILRDWMFYDASARLTGTDMQIDNGPVTKVSRMKYNHRDFMIEKDLGVTISAGGGGGANPMNGGFTLQGSNMNVQAGGDPVGELPSYNALQSLDYTYNAQGWLTMINQPTLGGTNIALPTCSSVQPSPGSVVASQSPDSRDLFYLQLNYDIGTAMSGFQSQKNGNISQITWRTRGRRRQIYNFTYDYLDRMEKGDLHQMDDAGVITGTPSFYERLTYADARGNIATLKRSGLYPTSGGCFATGLFDNLTYSYAAGTNRLRDISDAASSSIRTHGYKYYNVSGGDYGYDANGNITYDPSKGITITYNHLNKPTLIDFGSGKKIEYIYDASGTKLTKTVKLSNAAQYYQHYPSSASGQVGGIEYRQNPIGNAEIEAIYHSEGASAYTAGANPKYEYTIRDHLGNTRLTFCDLNGDGAVQTPSEILQENHYYPFGLSLHGPWTNAAAPDNLYQYSGKELQADHGLGWIDFGARMYMPEAGRWNGVDGLGEIYAKVSPYTYVANNPIIFTDPNGLEISTPELIRNAWYATPEGKSVKWFRNSKTEQDVPENTIYVAFDETRNWGYSSNKGKLSDIGLSTLEAQNKVVEALRTILVDNNGLPLDVCLLPQSEFQEVYSQRYSLARSKSFILVFTAMDIPSVGATSDFEKKILASTTAGAKHYKDAGYSTHNKLFYEWIALIGAHELGHIFLSQVSSKSYAEKHDNSSRNLMMDHLPDVTQPAIKQLQTTIAKWQSGGTTFRNTSATFSKEHINLMKKYFYEDK